MINSYYTQKQWQEFKKCFEKLETPFLLINLDIIQEKYSQLKKYFPYADIFYAVKANPSPRIISLLNELGANFDIASIYELDEVLALGISPEKISYSNTIKKAKDIQYAYQKGIRLFATDSFADLENLGKYAPGARVFFRILVEGAATADWPLSRKFGAHPDMVVDQIIRAKEIGLDPYGVSFHVGSQQKDIGTWDSAIAQVKYIFDWVKESDDISLKMINLGGGFPAKYLQNINKTQTYAKEINRFLREDFGDNLPRIILEPGRSIVGNSGVIGSEIVLISKKTYTAIQSWVYTDVGKFNGLIETLEESIKYPVYTEKMEENSKNGEVILAGPTCDGLDIMYLDTVYNLPTNLEIGDRLYWFSTGAYTASYSSVGFNGFPPIKTYFTEDFNN